MQVYMTVIIKYARNNKNVILNFAVGFVETQWREVEQIYGVQQLCHLQWKIFWFKLIKTADIMR